MKFGKMKDLLLLIIEN